MCYSPGVATIQRVCDDGDDDDLPPSDFTVSPPSMSPTSSLVTSADSVDLSHKKGQMTTEQYNKFYNTMTLY